ncbi:MAG: hypothetical protein ACFFBH_16575 [Promethearchaeota archaeon]
MNEKINDNEKKVKILIENYNRKTRTNELGKQEVVFLTLDELKSLLHEINEIPITKNYFYEDFEDYYPNIVQEYLIDPIKDALSLDRLEYLSTQIRIITKDFIIVRDGDDSFKYFKKSSKLMIFQEPYSPSRSFKLEEFTEFSFEFEKKRLLHIFIKYVIPFIFPTLLFLFLYFILVLYMGMYTYAQRSVNLFFIIFWIWLIFLTFINLIYSINLRFEKQEVDYTTPLLNQFKPYNLSKFITFVISCLGTIYLFIYYIVILGILIGIASYDEILELVSPIFELWDLLSSFQQLLIFILIIFIVTMLIIGFWDDIREFFEDATFFKVIGYFFYSTLILPFQIGYIEYKVSKKKKQHIVNYLSKYIQEENIDVNAKMHYLQLLMEVNKTPIVSVDLFSKLIAVFTFMLSVIPPFLNQFL